MLFLTNQNAHHSEECLKSIDMISASYITKEIRLSVFQFIRRLSPEARRPEFVATFLVPCNMTLKWWRHVESRCKWKRGRLRDALFCLIVNLPRTCGLQSISNANSLSGLDSWWILLLGASFSASYDDGLNLSCILLKSNLYICLSTWRPAQWVKRA